MEALLRVQASHVSYCAGDDDRMHDLPRPTLAQKPVTRRCWAHQRLWRLLRRRRPPQGWENWSERWLWPVADRLCQTSGSEMATLRQTVCLCVGCSKLPSPC